MFDHATPPLEAQLQTTLDRIPAHRPRMDVAEQERLADALRESESELRQMLDFAPQLVSVVGPAANTST